MIRSLQVVRPLWARPSARMLRRCFGNTTDPAEPVPIEAQFKNPIVAKLWAARQEAKKRLEQSDVSAAAAGDVRHRLPAESATEVVYGFSEDAILREAYQNPWGGMRIGKIMEDLDALAGNIAFHHVTGNPLIVTAGVDRIRTRGNPSIVQTPRDLKLRGQVTWVGSSSMEIRMHAQVDPDGGDDIEWLEAYFTFVTLHPETKKPVRIPALRPETNEERAHFELGALKAKAKKVRRQNRLQVGQPLSEASLQIDQLAASLLDQAGPLLSMPSLAPPDTILMAQTHMQNAMMAQPQVRNLHNRIFGGFLMRRAYELAFANAYLFGGQRPIFLEVDDISFDAPVDVGDLLVFNSRILYTRPDGAPLGDYVQGDSRKPLVMVEVETWVTEPEQVRARVSNHFYFTFALPDGTPCRTVVPSNLDQARRMAQRMMADEEQASLRS